jgi:hypothetical protein
MKMTKRKVKLATQQPDGYALTKVADVKPGTVLIADGGFDCLRNLELCTVKMDDRGELYVDDDQGRHDLEGQLNNDGTHYVGFWLSTAAAADQAVRLNDPMMAH